MVKNRFLALAKLSAKIADDKKGSRINILNVSKLTSIAEYFVIITADSSPQIKAIIDSIFKKFKEEQDIVPVHLEGRGLSSWAVLDYGGLVIHIMTPEQRDFYAIEKMWSEARRIKF
jgi:ribosome-associated protein